MGVAFADGYNIFEFNGGKKGFVGMIEGPEIIFGFEFIKFAK